MGDIITGKSYSKQQASLEDKRICERKRKINKDELKKAVEEKPDAYLYEIRRTL